MPFVMGGGGRIYFNNYIGLKSLKQMAHFVIQI